MQGVPVDASGGVLEARDELHDTGVLRMVPGPAGWRRTGRQAGCRTIEINACVQHSLFKLWITFQGCQERLVGFLEMGHS